jgi:ubiquinone/menaquinone biosynthesis C-methylase UbiE
MVIDPEAYEIAALLPRLPQGGSVVEIGCGDGRVTRRYSAHVASVIATDPNTDAIAAFRASGCPANVDARATSIFDLQMPDAAVDAVLFSWAL